MDDEWLNRLGIVLNFVAGFLIAPEVIGRDRIRRAEERIERLGQALNAATDQFIERDSGRDQEHPVASASVVFAVALLPPSLVWWRLSIERGVTAGWWVLAAVLLLSAIAVLMLVDEMPKSVTDTGGVVILISIPTFTGALVWSVGVVWTLIFLSVVMIGFALRLLWEDSADGCGAGCMVFLFVFVWPMVVGMVTAEALTIVVGSACRGALRILGPEHRLEGYLVAAGLTSFVVGNVMQLIATF